MNLRQVYWHGKAEAAMKADAFAFCPLCGERLENRVTGQRERKVCPACGFVHFCNPAPTVSLLIIEEEKVLFARRAEPPGQGCWATPSGYIELDEDYLTAAVREAKEETGLDIIVNGILNVTSSFFPPGQHFFNVYLLACVTGGALQAGDDTSELGWFPLTGPFPEMAFQEDVEMIAAYREECPILPCFIELS